MPAPAHPARPAALAALLLPAALAGAPAAAAEDPLAPHLWRSRVVVALAPAPGDPRLAEQRRIFDRLGREARERDLVLVEATDGTAAGAALRRRLGLGPGFRAALVGKDGGVKLSAAEPLEPGALLPLIDAMPMRRDEMRRGEAGPR